MNCSRGLHLAIFIIRQLLSPLITMAADWHLVTLLAEVHVGEMSMRVCTSEFEADVRHFRWVSVSSSVMKVIVPRRLSE